MKVNVETTSELGRKLVIEVPAESLQENIDQRMSKLREKAKLKGFRPGKVPSSVLQERYGKSIEFEAADELMRKLAVDALVEHKFNPAGQPQLDMVDQIEAGKPLVFNVLFEVYPEVRLALFSKLSIQKFETNITDADVDETIEKIRKQHTVWKTVDRKAKKDDQVIIDFDGKVDGKPLEGGSAQDFNLVLGSESMIPGFEKAIIGTTAGQELTAKVKFPQDYHVSDLVGQSVVFSIRVHQVQEAELPPVDDDFAVMMGVKEGGIKTFREQVQENMQRELEHLLQKKLRDEVFDSLCKANNIPLPKTLVNNEVQRVTERTRTQFEKQKLDFDAYEKKHQTEWKEQAERHVKLSLLFQATMEAADIKLDEERVKRKLTDLCSAYEHPDQMMQMYLNNKNQMAQIRALVLEDQIVDYITSQAKVRPKAISFAKLTETNH